ncbi:hypothetical protein [Paenibacillus roseipurpureus]|uniref:Uncharacterized protein n=1 Tax=Paenibacillus roseopurpureus TaxID=2918901 RepID=A0AA96RK66_9BACL|nr:hypothetical protein [Paenibacillus sp. MBLB1832]WNR44435.1 hypothetical protein MJB10_25790 [Paenibacillus sp. MBLB1832]
MRIIWTGALSLALRLIVSLEEPSRIELELPANVHQFTQPHPLRANLTAKVQQFGPKLALSEKMPEKSCTFAGSIS